MRGAQTDEQMDVIFHSTDCFRRPSRIIDDAARIGVQTFTPISMHQCHTVFCTEDQMIMQAEMC